jgi:hypothetical protein
VREFLLAQGRWPYLFTQNSVGLVVAEKQEDSNAVSRECSFIDMLLVNVKLLAPSYRNKLEVDSGHVISSLLRPNLHIPKYSLQNSQINIAYRQLCCICRHGSLEALELATCCLSMPQ